MGNLLLLFFILIICGIVWALPVYFGLNFLFWVFHITLHITLLQAFAVCLMVNIIVSMFFKNK